MSAYEFDQPLDLRLKALNLSMATTCHQSICNDHAMTNNSGICNNSLLCGGICTNGCRRSSSISSRIGSISSIGSEGSSLSLGNTSLINNHGSSSMRSLPLNEAHQATSASQNISNSHELAGYPKGMHAQPAARIQATPTRLTAIHCQPLNHYQPHPSSLMYLPSGSQRQPANDSAAPRQHSLQQQQPQTSPQSPPVSHQQPPPTIPPQRLQSSSPQRHHYPMPPIKSMSLSSHMLGYNLSALSQSPPVSSPEAGNDQSASRLDSDAVSPQLVKLPGHLAKQHVQPVSMTSNGAYSIALHNQDSNTGDGFGGPSNRAPPTPVITTATSSPPITSVGLYFGNHGETTSVVAPITRQHSLVSRYNCKPCGIVFSQPETLRAHQEGYCTKRDRVQTQMRSQSAVSPIVVQQCGDQ